MNKATHELAWNIWKLGGQPKKEALSSEQLCLCKTLSRIIIETETGEIKFAKEEEMIKCAVAYCANSVFLPLIDKPNDFFRLVQQTWYEDSDRKSKVSAQALAQIHNNDSVDIFDLAASTTDLAENPFGILHDLTEAFPFLAKINISKVFELAGRTYEKEKRDFAGGMMHNALSEWLIPHPEEAREIISQHIKEPKESSANLYRVAILALGKADFSEGYEVATKGVTSREPIVAGPAMDTFGFFDYQLPLHKEEFERAFQAVESILANKNHDHFFTAAQTLTRLVDIEPARHEALLHLAETDNVEAIFALSNFLFLKQDKYGDQPWFLAVAMFCAVAKCEHSGTIHNLDMFLFGWIGRVHDREQVIEWLEKWIRNQDDKTIRNIGIDKAFPSFVHNFVLTKGHLSAAITDWLVHEDIRFSLTAERLIRYAQIHRIENIGFDEAKLENMDNPTLLLLVRRTLGYVYWESILLSLIWSLTRAPNANERVYQLVGNVFVSHLGYNYPKSTEDFVLAEQKKLSPESALYQLCTNILQGIADIYKQLADLPRLKELAPMVDRLRIVREKRHKSEQAMRGDVDKESVFFNVITKIPLKAGTGSFSLFQGDYTETNKLTSFSYAINIPRNEAIDQVGADRERFFFRISKKGDA